MNDQANDAPVEKLRTGIASFDVIAKGGLPRNRTTLLSGTAGSGKTVFAMQFLAAGIRDADEHGAFVNASPDPHVEIIESGGFDLGALLARVQNAVRKVNAKRVSVDSLGAVFS